MPKRRGVLLRIANVNPDSVNTHSDRVLYRAIGVFIMLYCAYATAGGAAFVDASAGYRHPWWQWVVGALVATGVVAYDRAVVGRVAVSFEHLESADPRHLLKRPTVGLYLGRLGLALLFAVLITEPLMLARYRGEIDARLSEVHSRQLTAAESRGLYPLGAYLWHWRLVSRTTGWRAGLARLRYWHSRRRASARPRRRTAGCPPGRTHH
jgi:hypothetical protein